MSAREDDDPRLPLSRDLPIARGLEALPDLFDAASEQLPGVARIAASAALQSTVWTGRAYLRASRLMLRAVSDPEVAGELIDEVAHDVAYAAGLVSNVARRVGSGVPLSQALMESGQGIDGGGDSILEPPPSPRAREAEDRDTLRARGAALLDASRDVMATDDVHPAFVSILANLAPDEARILLMMLTRGPQPMVDIRTGGPVGVVSSKLIAGGLNMVGPRAGLRFVDRVPSYLNNLSRLGLIWMSRETLDDPIEYQVVEAQPEVLEAMHSTHFTKAVRRSIHLTRFGEDFCRTCLVDQPDAAAAYPLHAAPPEKPDDKS